MPKDYKDKNHPVRIDTIKIIDKNNGSLLRLIIGYNYE